MIPVGSRVQQHVQNQGENNNQTAPSLTLTAELTLSGNSNLEITVLNSDSSDKDLRSRILSILKNTVASSASFVAHQHDRWTE
jgi:hypothetical protein